MAFKLMLLNSMKNLLQLSMYKKLSGSRGLYYLLWILIPIVQAKLKLCSEPVDEIQLCKYQNEYRANDPPNPKPAILTPILTIQNVLDVDHDKKSITLYFTIELHWKESRLNVSIPEGISFKSKGGWYKIVNENKDHVWTPKLTFQDIIESKELTDWGKGGTKFNLWFASKKQKMTFSKTMKVTLTCDFHFENYVGIVQECKIITCLLDYHDNISAI